MSLEFHLPKFHGTGLFSKEGGPIDFEIQFSGSLNELFSHVEPVISGFTQYRKVFIRNSGQGTLTGIRVWMDEEEYSGNGMFALGSGISRNQFIGSPVGQPTGIFFTGGYSNYDQSLFLMNDLGPNHHTGFWIRQTFSGLSGKDPYGETRLYVGWKEK